MSRPDIGSCDASVEELLARFSMSTELEACLEDLEARIDPDAERALLADYRCFLEGDWQEPVFAPRRVAENPERYTWPEISTNQGLVDFNHMALQQLRGCSRQLARAGGAPLTVRANYGVCISSSWFGTELVMMDAELNTLPTNRPIEGGRDAIDALLDAGLPPVTSGYAARVYAMGRIYKDIMTPYPKVREHVHVYHPDLQSPIDTCELVWGSDMLLALYECPERVHRFLELLTETYIRGIAEWDAILPFDDEINAHWTLLHKGKIMLRTDSGMNLSPAMYDSFVRPYEQRCLEACGGGAIHFCGRGDHFIASMTEQRGLTGINMSQPELNDMETIYRHTVDRGIPLLGLQRAAAEEAVAAGRQLHGLVLAA